MLMRGAFLTAHSFQWTAECTETAEVTFTIVQHQTTWYYSTSGATDRH